MNPIIEEGIFRDSFIKKEYRHCAKPYKPGSCPSVGSNLTALCGAQFTSKYTGTVNQILQSITCPECIFKVRNIYNV